MRPSKAVLRKETQLGQPRVAESLERTFANQTAFEIGAALDSYRRTHSPPNLARTPQALGNIYRRYTELCANRVRTRTEGAGT